jgi:hypothetical protein
MSSLPVWTPLVRADELPSRRPSSRARAWLVLRRVLSTRPAQFALFGAAIFFVSHQIQKGRATLAFTDVELGVLRGDEARRRNVDPKDAALAAAVRERALEDEILYREGLALGFDRNDAIVRQRIIQKTLFLAEELAGASEPPTDAELRAYYEKTRSQWRRPEVFHLEHAFARDRASIDAIGARAAAGEDLRRLGESCPLPRDVTMPRERIESLLGSDFARALESTPIGSPSAPIASSLGWHVVRVVARAPEAQESFEDAKGHLIGAYVVARRQDAVAAYLDRVLHHYQVTIDGEPVTALRYGGRVAIRKTGSAED